MLTLDDTLGMFLLLAFGFTLAIIAFVNECLTHYNKHIFCCKGQPEAMVPPAITLTSAENTPVTSVENLEALDTIGKLPSASGPSRSLDVTPVDDINASVYDLQDHEQKALIVRSISPHRRYSMTQIDDRILEVWAKKRFSH